MTNRRLQPVIQTFSGRRVNPFKPDPDEFDIEDIAHALANQCRFGGHCRAYYSVAQHSCLLTDLVEAEHGDAVAQRWALLHDAAEAYLVDLPHPLKHGSDLGRLFRQVEQPLQAAICQRFGLQGEPPSRLREIDRALLATEKAALVRPAWDWPELQGIVAVTIAIDPWLPPQAADEFITRYERTQAHIPLDIANPS